MSNTKIVTAFQQTLRKSFQKNSLLHKNTHATKIIQTTAENQLDFQWDSPYRSIQLLMIYKAGTKKKKKNKKKNRDPCLEQKHVFVAIELGRVNLLSLKGIK